MILKHKTPTDRSVVRNYKTIEAPRKGFGTAVSMERRSETLAAPTAVADAAGKLDMPAFLQHNSRFPDSYGDDT